MKQKIRKLIRKMLSCREHETIEDNITRHITNLKKRILKRKYGIVEFEKAVRQVGIQEGDSIIVHCAWRDFYNFTGKPEDVIDALLKIIGPEGNLLMPCYGDDIDYFDVRETKSAAGVLSEVFRTKYPCIRSCCNHFSMAVMGPDAEELTNDHIKSINGFDEYSPYAKAGGLKNSKILLLGLGRKPKKFSLIHVVEFEMKDCDKKCNVLFTKKHTPKVIVYKNGENYIESHEMLYWEGKRKLNGTTIRRIYQSKNGYKQIHLSNLDIISVDYLPSKKYISKGILNGIQFTI